MWSDSGIKEWGGGGEGAMWVFGELIVASVGTRGLDDDGLYFFLPCSWSLCVPRVLLVIYKAKTTKHVKVKV